MKKPKNLIKYIIGLFTVIVLRIVPHPPNVEPIMSTMMPFAKRWGKLAGMVFTLLAILSFDLITGTLGVWSIMTAGTYALLGIAAGVYFKKKQSNIKNYVKFSVIGTLVYDAITGIGTGVLFFNQSFMITLIGQIPFTLYHLGGNIVLAAIVSPLLYTWVLDNPQMETQPVINKVKSFFISSN
ncbi:MAG: hypothetical protein PHV16_03955 [Candidatus Nanoarchaeia archaeon]|nr:hypothetical protein [Candidatus Nanoarchaeia archaeon]